MHFPTPPAAVVFDMDGLLLDTERLYRETAILAARVQAAGAPRRAAIRFPGRSLA